jgi:hypothetical protein
MGYTHYWEISRDFTNEEWDALTDEATRIIGLAGKLNIKLGDALGDFEPVITKKRIALNGYGNAGCESFILTKNKRETAEWERERENNAVFDFCKTRQLPYDAVVVSILFAANKVAPNAIRPSSDGGDIFEPAIDILAAKMLGVSKENKTYQETNREIVEKKMRETLDNICNQLDINFVKFGVSEDLHKTILFKFNDIYERVDALTSLFKTYDSFFEVADALNTEVKKEYKLFKNLNELTLITQYANN